MTETTIATANGSRPKLDSIKDLINASLPVYKEKFWRFILMMLVPILGALPILFVGGFYLLARFVFAWPGELINPIFIFLAIVGVLFAIYLGIVSQISLLLLLKPENKEAGIWSIFKSGGQYFWRYFFLEILLFIIIFVGFIFLIVPGVAALGYFGFAVYALIFEDQKIIESIKRSAFLVKDYWWSTVGRILAVYVPFYLIVIIPTIFMEEKGSGVIAWNFIVNILSFVIAPFFMVYLYGIYQNLVKLKK